MTFNERGFPPAGVLRQESRLLRLAQDWQRKIA
jgi:hypothetical protein